MKNKKLAPRKVIDHLLTKVPVFGPEVVVSLVIKEIRSYQKWETINYVYVVNSDRDLIGVISIKELLRAKNTSEIGRVMVRNPVSVSASANQERAAVLAINQNIKAVPVVKAGTREFLGVVGTDDILGILHRKHVTDLLRFSGITEQHPTVDILKINSFELYRVRIPWLLIGLVGGILATVLVGQFEDTLRKEIALSFFIPVLVYISNAIAVQTQILLIRKLATQDIKGGYIKKELLVSLLLSSTSALILSVYTFFWLGSLAIALTIALSVLASTIVAVIIATAIPLSLYALKKDPALGSGPMATAIQDLTTLLIYFLIAAVIIF